MTSPHRAALGSAAVALALAVAGCSSSPGQTGPDDALSRAAADVFVDPVVLPGARPTPPASHPTPITVSAIGDPLVVLGSDGKQHIDYDLLVTTSSPRR